jgi:cell division septum initiation protein DivIVA
MAKTAEEKFYLERVKRLVKRGIIAAKTSCSVADRLLEQAAIATKAVFWEDRKKANRIVEDAYQKAAKHCGVGKRKTEHTRNYGPYRSATYRASLKGSRRRKKR